MISEAGTKVVCNTKGEIGIECIIKDLIITNHINLYFCLNSLSLNNVNILHLRTNNKNII